MRRISSLAVVLALGLIATPVVAQDEPEAEEAEVEEAEDEAPDEEADEEVADEEAVEDEEEVADEEEDDLFADEPDEADDQDEPAPAADDDPVATDHPMLAVTPRIGLTAPQPFGELNSWPVFGADVGYILPFDLAGFERPLQIGVEAAYTQPGATGEGHHPMLGQEGADYEWELDQRILSLQFTTMFRFNPPAQGLNFHALLGPRVYLMESVMEASGNDGQDFGENRETNTEYGVVFGGGVEYELGPGSLVGTLQIGGGPLEQRITGDANTGAFNVDVGYRLFF